MSGINDLQAENSTLETQIKAAIEDENDSDISEILTEGGMATFHRRGK
jgi:hypothetical protein